MAIRRILTGIRPTGALHLGHYVGALKQWVELQKEYECFFLIADVQALTTHVEKPDLIEESVREVMLDWVAVGLDPSQENIHFVLQSGIPELTELTTYFTMIVPFTAMEHNPTIRAERKNLRNPTAGFMVYPISQAADILLFTSMLPGERDKVLVPVGEDQVPHLEGTNAIARKFNQLYGKEIFPGCIAKVGDVGRLPGISGDDKMSKSLGNAIFLKDSADTVSLKVSKMFTDPKKLRQGDVGHPRKCPVYLYHKAFSEKKMLKGRAKRCQNGVLGCVECKIELAQALNLFLTPIRARRAEAEKMPLGDFLAEGTQKAREIGQTTMETVRKVMHLNYPSVFGK